MAVSSLLTRFQSWIEEMETMPAGPLSAGLVLAGTVAVRNLLEVMVANNPAFKGLSALIHYPLAYVAPFLALTLVLAFWSRVAPARVARLMVLAWLLTLIPPLADLLLHHRSETPTIGYLVAEPIDLPRIFLNFFNPWANFGGTTPGIRIEAAAAVLLGGVYVALKARSFLRVSGAMISIYLTSLFFFTLPVLVLTLFRLTKPRITRDDFLWGQGTIFRPDTETSPDSMAILWLVPLIGGLVLAWRRLEKRHPNESWFGGVWGRPDAPGLVLGLSLVVWAGQMAAIWINFPVETNLISAPFDRLAVLGAALAVLLAGSVAVRRNSSDRVLLGLCLMGAVCLTAALGRTVAMGITATVGPLLFLGSPWIPRRFQIAAGPLIAVVGTIAAWATGHALVVGPEGFARLPQDPVWFVAAGGLGLGVLTATGCRLSPVWGAVTAGVTAGAGTLVLGGWTLALIGLGAGAVSGFFGRWADTERPSTEGFWTGLLMGITLLILGRGAVTAPAVREELNRESRNQPRLSVIRAEQYEKENRWETARSFYKEALKFAPDYLPAMRGLGLGVVKNEPEKFAMGLDLLEKVARNPQALPTDWSNLASAYIRQGRWSEALPLLEKAFARDPYNTDILFNRAAALESGPDKEAARRAWQEFLNRAQHLPELQAEVQEVRKRLKALP